MRPPRASWKFGVAALVLGGVSWLLVRSLDDSAPYRVGAAALSAWTIRPAASGERGIVVLQPGSGLTTALFEQALKRSGGTLVPPEHPSMPLVLAEEYAASLQGVLSVDDLVAIARHTGLESARFEPICLAQYTRSAPGNTGELLFVLFESPLFDEFRQKLVPLHQEHGGTAPFEPAALRPVLAVGSTDRSFTLWPATVDARADCRAPIELD